MHFQFDPNQECQLRAVEAVVDLFEGQHRPTVRPARRSAAGDAEPVHAR